MKKSPEFSTSEPSSTSSKAPLFRIRLEAPPDVPRSDDVIKELCELAVASVRRMEAIALAMEKALGEQDLPASEVSRVVRTILVARTNSVKLVTNAVSELSGPLKTKKKAVEV